MTVKAANGDELMALVNSGKVIGELTGDGMIWRDSATGEEVVQETIFPRWIQLSLCPYLF